MRTRSMLEAEREEARRTWQQRSRNFQTVFGALLFGLGWIFIAIGLWPGWPSYSFFGLLVWMGVGLIILGFLAAPQFRQLVMSFIEDKILG